MAGMAGYVLLSTASVSLTSRRVADPYCHRPDYALWRAWGKSHLMPRAEARHSALLS